MLELKAKHGLKAIELTNQTNKSIMKMLTVSDYFEKS